MILAGLFFAGLATVWLAYAGWLSYRNGIGFQQALLLAPLAAIWRLDAAAIRRAHDARPMIYVVAHQSQLDPALMISLLPDDTLHILDETSAKAAWLEPWRATGRTIAFNPEHVFVSRRLVRMLRGGGRLCVYMPADVAPESREFRLYRAVARIALRANAKTMPVSISGARARRLLPKLVVRALPAATIGELVAQSGSSTNSGALFDRVTETGRPSERQAA
jgi:acyl-[acyl-carrier-protein]-phospholipid O-acyltransferase/long-chain-fatty-acid--[acyl-carrier-protein] ligase